MKQRLKILIGLFFLFLLIVISIIVHHVKSKYSNRSLIIPKEDDTEELVVVVCNEDIEEWLDDYAPKYQKVTVYSKCGRQLQFKSKNVEVIQSPNIGTCDHGFLTYIIDRYNDLPDFVEFTKGWRPPIRKYYECLPCQKNIDQYLKKIYNFKLKYYDFYNSKNRNIVTTNYKPSYYNNMGEWIKHNNFIDESIYIRNTCNIILGGQFGIAAYNIRKTPKIVWENIRSQQKYPREEVDHFIERTWGPLLCKPEYKLVVVSIFKNEAHCIREWLQHYMRQGVEHFYMIDNGSTDNWKKEIKGLPVTIIVDTSPIDQIKLYNKYYLDIVKIKSDWVIVVDLDEFMYARKEYKNILEYLDKISEDIGEIQVSWKYFGTNNYIEQPESIIKSFTRRVNMDSNWREKCKKNRGFNHDIRKSIVRTINLTKLGIHTHSHNGKILKLMQDETENDLSNMPLHLNHYIVQSESFYNNKINRKGFSKFSTESQLHTTNFLEETKELFNEVEDLELSNIYDELLPLYTLNDAKGSIINNLNYEVAEQKILKDTLKNGDRVLQLGGNIGTSCITAGKINNLKVNHCVEPQSFLTKILKNNIKKNYSNAEIIHGIISEDCKDMKISSNDGDLAAFTEKSSHGEKVFCHSLHSIKPENGYTYLFMDCEGCAPGFIQEYGKELSKHPIHTIVYEEDQGDRLDPVDYTPVNNFMKQNNFKCEGNFHKVCKKQNSIIPKIIHKVLLNHTGIIVIDNDIKEAQESWTKYNKDYTLKLWNFSDCREYLINNFPNIYIETFDNLIPYSYKCDFFRFCLIYNEGGWYSDWKEVCLVLNLLDNLSQDGDIILFDDKNHKQKTPYQYTMTGFFGAIPKHYILKNTIDGIILNVKNKYYGRDCLYPTGPGILGEIVNKYSLKTLGYFDKNYYYHKKLGKIIEHKCKTCGQTQDWVNGNNYGKLWKEKKIYKN
jgi:FkbM family methyltransferase